jgi:hypothetical protein
LLVADQGSGWPVSPAAFGRRNVTLPREAPLPPSFQTSPWPGLVDPDTPWQRHHPYARLPFGFKTPGRLADAIRTPGQTHFLATGLRIILVALPGPTERPQTPGRLATFSTVSPSMFEARRYSACLLEPHRCGRRSIIAILNPLYIGFPTYFKDYRPPFPSAAGLTMPPQ